MKDFENKVVIVTGAANGIGRSTAIQFAEEGAKVAIADIDEAGLIEVAETLGGDVLTIPTDVGDKDACQAMVDRTVEHFGRLDIIFNNAGIGGDRGLTGDLAYDDWERVINVNLNAVFYCTKSAIPEMLKVGGGVIINTSSVDGLVGQSTIAHYTASKHGVMGLTKACAMEYAKKNIRCVAIAPGFIDTKIVRKALSEEEITSIESMIPGRRGGSPGEVANLVIWLASDKASYITGTSYQVDGGILSGFDMT